PKRPAAATPRLSVGDAAPIGDQLSAPTGACRYRTGAGADRFRQPMASRSAAGPNPRPGLAAAHGVEPGRRPVALPWPGRYGFPLQRVQGAYPAAKLAGRGLAGRNIERSAGSARLADRLRRLQLSSARATPDRPLPE